MARGFASQGRAATGWLGALCRYWLLMRVDRQPAGRAGVVGTGLSIVLIAAWFGIDRWQRQPDPVFAPSGIPLLGWYAVAIAIFAWLLRAASRPRVSGEGALLLTLGLAPVPLGMASVVFYMLDPPWFRVAAGAAALYSFVYLARGLRGLTGRRQWRAPLLALAFLAAFAWASDALDAIPDVWNPHDAAEPAAALADLGARETSLFEQAARIDDALEGLGRSGSLPQGFFLGFAGVGEQRVFAEEVHLAARTFAARFPVGERRLFLINDERDLEGAPLASVSGLAYALKGMAAHMALDRDILFLAISSHGTAEPAIAVSNNDLPLTALYPEDLADALREAGIRWRVIVISACYAGGFIEALRNPQTVVITAAAADRTSFGCSSDRDLTYFGEAFYRDALPNAKSLRSAFEAASAAIALRERNEHVTPSKPQAYFGRDIEPKLDALAQ